MKEFFDVCDKNRKPLGYTHVRGKALDPGEYHIVVAVWTIDRDGRLLITRRDAAKASFPLYWENTCGGVRAGETPQTAVCRELREETGICAQPEQMLFLGTSLEDSVFVDTYLLLLDEPKPDICLQEGETCDARWVYADELDRMIEDALVAEPVVDRLAPLRIQLNDHLQNRTSKLLKTCKMYF